MTKNEKLTLIIASLGLAVSTWVGFSQLNLQDEIRNSELQRTEESKRREVIRARPRLVGDTLYMRASIARASLISGSTPSELSHLESHIELIWENRSGEMVKVLRAFSLDTTTSELVLRKMIFSKDKCSNLTSELNMMGSITNLFPGRSIGQNCIVNIGHQKIYKHFIVLYENEYGDMFDSYHVKEFHGIVPCQKTEDCGDRISTGTFKGGVDNDFKYYEGKEYEILRNLYIGQDGTKG